VRIVANAVHAKYLPWKIKTGDLFLTIVCRLIGLNSSRADGVHRLKIVTFPVQMLVLLQGFASLDDVVQLLDIIAL
jgi:hypothetical protein